jgi:hypothetical protein
MEAGEIEFAMYGVIAFLSSALQSGRSLEALESDCRLYVRQMHEYGRVFSKGNCSLFWQTILNLMGRAAGDPVTLTGEALDEAEFRKTATPFQLCLLRFFLAMTYTWFGEHEKCAKLAIADFDSLAKVYLGSVLVTMDCFYKGVSLFAMSHSSKNKRYTKYAKKALMTIKRWVEKGNPNVRHYEALLEAEMTVNSRWPHVAKKNYEIAIALSTKGGFIQDAALAQERFGDFLLRSGDRDEASFQFGEAIKLYNEWGAKAKALQLQRQHADLWQSSAETSHYFSPF